MTGCTAPFRHVLRLGSKGTEPVAVKRGLWHAGFRQGWDALDGEAISAEVLGSIAAGNLRTFQTYHGLTPDGVYGPRSHQVLRGSFDDYACSLYTGGAATVQLPYPYVGTHHTAGLDWPGLDAIDIFADPGTRVLAPLEGVLTNTHMIDWDERKRVGGMTTYLVADRGMFFLTHFKDLLPSGTRVERGQDMGSVAAVPRNWWTSHIHEGFKRAV